jgi:RNA polymerase sigma-70 factor (ECF subfamily)
VPSFDHVYEQTFDFAWRSARRLGVAASAVDDVVQDAFLVVHRRLPEFEGRSSMKTWVFGILLRVVSDHRRTLRRKGGLAELPHEDVLASRAQGPAETLEQRQAAALLHALLDELDDEKRAVFVLAELEELAAPDIAEMLSIPTNTVYSRLRAAREAFERSLARHRARERGELDRARSKERP